MIEWLFDIGAVYTALQLGRWLEERRLRALFESQANRERFLRGDWS